MNKYMRLAFAVLVIQGLMAVSAMAGWKFWKSDDDKAKAKEEATPQWTREAIFVASSDEVEKELLTFMRSRELVSKDVAVLTRLVRAKQAQFADVQDKLQKEFGIEPAKQYDYDSTAMIIYEAKTDKAEKKEFKKLETAEKGQIFLNMLALKRRLDGDITVLERVDKEQSENLANIHSVLLRKYGVRRDRQYQYDKNKKTLYEVTLKAPAGQGKSEKSEEEAE